MANRRLRKVEKDVAKRTGRCLFVIDESGEYCGEPVTNNCHIASETAVLEGLRDDKTQKVLDLQWGVSPWRETIFSDDAVRRVGDTNTFDPSERTTSVACTGRFACKARAHDDEFQPADVADPDFNDPDVRLLSALRMAMYQVDQLRLALELHRKWHRTVRRNPGRSGSLSIWEREKAKYERQLGRAESRLKLLGKQWHARKTRGEFDPGVVSASTMTFRSKLRLAGGVFYGQCAAICLFPLQGDWHRMGALYLRSESDEAQEDLELLREIARTSETSDSYGVTAIEELLTRGWGSIAASPKSYETLNDQDRFSIRSLVERHSSARDLVMDPSWRQSVGMGRRSRR